MRARIYSAATLALAVAAAVAACGGDDDDSSATNPPADKDSGTDSGPIALCVDGKPTVAYPPGPYGIDRRGTIDPELSFNGPDGPVRIGSLFDPCAPRAKLLVVRTVAAWCAPCVWHATHTKTLLSDPGLDGRISLLDLVVADEDNMPATVATAAAWKAKVDAPAELAAKVAIDPAFTFAKVRLSRGPIPAYVYIDVRTMKILSTDQDPSPEALKWKIGVELADLDRVERPRAANPMLTDGLFTAAEMDLLRGMKLEGGPPPDPTNEYGDVPAAAALGKKLFSDKELSPSKTVSCATCHDAARDFTDGAGQSTGVAKVDRNSPGVALAAHSRWQFWDGRADTLWMQALGPPEDKKEIGSSRLYIAHEIATRYAAEYTAVFGTKYPLPAIATLPPSGKPGDPAYDALSDADKEKVTRIYVNVGKAIAAFERSLRVQPNAFDRYVDGDLSALTQPQKEGLQEFFRSGCAQCHWGPRLTDDAFHNLRFETGRQDGQPDTGRFDILAKLPNGEFVATSKWSDAPSAAKLLTLPIAQNMLGAFKTPTLRGLSKSAPYGHGGTLTTLMDVAKHYGERGLAHDNPKAVGTTEQWVMEFDTNVQAKLPAFLEVLTGDVIVP